MIQVSVEMSQIICESYTNSCHNRTQCDRYELLLQERQFWRNLCDEMDEKIFDLKIQKTDERKLIAKLKTRQILREYIEQLNEKAEILKRIMHDLGQEFISVKSEYEKAENVLSLQESALEKAEKANQEVERRVNEEIDKIRKGFIDKWKKLCEIRDKFNLTQSDIAETCKDQMKLEAELNQKKLDLKKSLCELKKFRKSSSSVAPSVTLKMLKNLRKKEAKYLRKFNQIETEVECFKRKICEADQEMKVVRKVVRSQLHVAKMHNDWRWEQLEIRKRNLEPLIDDQLVACDDEDKKVSHDMRMNISRMAEDVSGAKKTVENLESAVQHLLEKPDSCRAKNFKSSTNVQQRIKKPEAQVIKATDYLGSTFFATNI